MTKPKSYFPKKRGRPPKYAHYDLELPKQLVEYFDVPVFKEDGKLNRIPSLVSFCREKGIRYGAMRHWLASENREYFSDLQEAWAESLALFERNLVEAGITGKANAIFTIHVTKNMLGWRDKQELELGGKMGWASIAKRVK